MPETRLPSINDFSPFILKGDVRGCLQAIIDGGGNDETVYNLWAAKYFKGVKNKRSRVNIPATLRSTGLAEPGKPLILSDVGKSVLAAPTAQEASKLFCAHLLREKNGKILIESLSALRKRKKKVTKESLQEELTARGITDLANGTTDHSTIKNWLIHAGLVTKEGDPKNDEIKSILGISSSELDEFKSLSLGQQIFLHVLRKRHEMSPGPFQVTEIRKECTEKRPALYDAHFAKKVRKPLEASGWVVAAGLAKGPYGGRSGQISGSKKLLDIPLTEVIPDFDQVIPAELREKLNIPLDVLSRDLFGKNKHKAGLALELLALRMIMDLGLEPRNFRLRSAQTAFAEVDLIAEGAHLLFSRWTFQCKRYDRSTTTKLGLGDVAKEVGIAVYAKAHVIVMVTTTDFSEDARNYALEVTRATHLQFVFIDGKLIDAYLRKGKPVLLDHVQENAREVMASKRVQPLPSGE
ncbi:MAG: restriction endonuclease [Pseudomonadota bacterium]